MTPLEAGTTREVTLSCHAAVAYRGGEDWAYGRRLHNETEMKFGFSLHDVLDLCYTFADVDLVRSLTEPATSPTTTGEALDLSQFKGHTPGPWEIIKQTEESGHRGAWNVMSGGLAWHVAESWRVSEPDKSEVNARLIAAAPALLEEVQRLRALSVPKGVLTREALTAVIHERICDRTNAHERSSPEDLADAILSKFGASPEGVARELNRVQQEDENGCAVACLASLVGEPYQAIRRGFPQMPSQGLSEVDICHWLNERGWWTRRWWVQSPPQQRTRLAIAMVKEPSSGHYIVVDGDSAIDPARQKALPLHEYKFYRWIDLLAPSSSPTARNET